MIAPKKNLESNSRAGRGWAAVAAIVAAAGCGAWLVSARAMRGGAVRHRADKPTGRLIAEAAPTAAGDATPPEDESPAPPRDPHEGMRLSAEGVWQPADRPYRPGRKKVHGVFTNRVNRANNGVAKNGVEQMMIQIFTRERGDMPPPIPPQIPAWERQRLAEILMDRAGPEAGDTEDVLFSKETLDLARTAMREFIKDGGEPEDFFLHYHNELTRCFYARNDAQIYIQKMVEDGEDPQVIQDFVDKVNDKFEEEGIKPIHNPNTVEVITK